MADGMNRRRFLKVLGATGGGAATLSACGVGAEPAQTLIPYLVPPDDQIPGTATWYATTCRECSAGCGVHVRIREGRAVKLEGNPDAVNRGRLCARGQAALQGLYNPDRVRTPLVRNDAGQLESVEWDRALEILGQKLEGAPKGGIVCVTGHEPTALGDLIDEWMRGLGGRRVSYEPFGFEALREGHRLAFGAPDVPRYDFSKARYVLSFGADFLETWLTPVPFQNGFAQARAFAGGHGSSMARLAYVGPRLGVTGMNADEWIGTVPGTEGLLALAMAAVVVRERGGHVPADATRLRETLARHAPERVGSAIGVEAGVIERLARDFAASDAPLAVAGGMAAHYPNGAEIVAAVNILNYVAGAFGNTVRFEQPLAVGASFRDAGALSDDMTAGRVAVLLVQGANPAHSLGTAFRDAADHVPYKVSFASVFDETTALADLVLPDLHPLEQWNDVHPHDGAALLQQPVVQPVVADARHAGDVILEVMGRSDSFMEYLQERWRVRHRDTRDRRSFEQFWLDVVQHAGVSDSKAPAGRTVRLGPSAGGIGRGLAPEAPDGATTLVVFPHPVLYDGRAANKPWLQELPDPVSKIAWHAWAELHPETAAEWSVVSGDLVELRTANGHVELPVWVTPSVRAGVVAVPTGQGHTAYGRYATGRSANAFDLLSADPNGYGGRTFVTSVEVRATGGHRPLASVEGSTRQHGQKVAKVLSAAAAAALRPGDHPFHEEEFPHYAEQAMEGWGEAQEHKRELGDYAKHQPRWAMAVDLSRCTGCSACVTACYAENNLATVGEDLILRGREMSWLRIERYFRGGPDPASLSTVVAPMMCQHCGNAPCEPVCPVYAAYHTPDGLNGQVYNRCVGTRYCANNCPYKVRYFNWFDYAEAGGAHDAWPDPLHLLLNPDVTVREKGVMEKCTFCVQRIRGAQNQARLEDRAVRDGEIVPACAQTCPSEALVFGDLHDPSSRVAALAKDPRGYHVLANLNTKPAVTYLARVVDRADAMAHGAEH